MVWLSCTGQLVLMSTLVLTTSSLSNPRPDEDNNVLQSQTGVHSRGSCSNAPLGEQLSLSGGSLGSGGSRGSLRPREEERRQLGDIEFSSRYAEYLRAKAKHISLCTFLKRMQTVRTSSVQREEEKVNELLTQYRRGPTARGRWGPRDSVVSDTVPPGPTTPAQTPERTDSETIGPGLDSNSVSSHRREDPGALRPGLQDPAV
ncbi:unnamed protein product [Gadus morhua 'NCC']